VIILIEGLGVCLNIAPFTLKDLSHYFSVNEAEKEFFQAGSAVTARFPTRSRGGRGGQLLPSNEAGF